MRRPIIEDARSVVKSYRSYDETLFLPPSRLSRFLGYALPLRCRHGLKPSLTAYPSALAPHSGHDAGDGIGDFRGGFAGFGLSGSANHLKRSLVYIERA